MDPLRPSGCTDPQSWESRGEQVLLEGLGGPPTRPLTCKPTLQLASTHLPPAQDCPQQCPSYPWAALAPLQAGQASDSQGASMAAVHWGGGERSETYHFPARMAAQQPGRSSAAASLLQAQAILSSRPGGENPRPAVHSATAAAVTHVHASCNTALWHHAAAQGGSSAYPPALAPLPLTAGPSRGYQPPLQAGPGHWGSAAPQPLRVLAPLSLQQLLQAQQAQQPAMPPLAPSYPPRGRSRKLSARRSLSGSFDVAAALQEQDQQQQGSEDFTVAEDAASDASSWDAMDTEGPSSSTPPQAQPVGWNRQHPGIATWGPAAALLPLQQLLMSDRAQNLSMLEVKAVIYRVCADLSSLHTAGAGGHCHVSISSIALAHNGDLATTRLLPSSTASGTGAAGACASGAERCALGLGARWAGRGSGSGQVAADGSAAEPAAGAAGFGSGAYVPPEVARCTACWPAVADSPSADMWSLGVVLFVLLSGGYVPFGHRGLCQTCVPNMPGPQEKVDKMQDWLEAHLYHKVAIIQQMSKEQSAVSLQMRVVGFDQLSCDLLLALLKADPAQRLTAAQVLGHPWLSEVVGLVPLPLAPLTAATRPIPAGGSSHASCGDDNSPPAHKNAHNSAHLPDGPGSASSAAAAAEALLRRHGSALLSLAEACGGSGGFSPSTPPGPDDVLHRGASIESLTPTDSETSLLGSVSDLLLLSGAGSTGVSEPGDMFSPLFDDSQCSTSLPGHFLPPPTNQLHQQYQQHGLPQAQQQQLLLQLQTECQFAGLAPLPAAPAALPPLPVRLLHGPFSQFNHTHPPQTAAGCQKGEEAYAASVLGRLQGATQCYNQQQQVKRPCHGTPFEGTTTS